MTTIDELRESWKSFDNVLIYDMVSNHGNALSSTLYGLRTEAEKRGDYQQAEAYKQESRALWPEKKALNYQDREGMLQASARWCSRLDELDPLLKQILAIETAAS